MTPLATRNLLTQLYREIASFEFGDDGVTTFCSVGVILVAAALSAAQDPAELSELTRLPVTFAKLVIERATSFSLWTNPNWHKLGQDLAQRPWNIADVEESICTVVEDLLLKEPTPFFDWAMETAREGRVYGGRRQSWYSRGNHTQGISDYIH